MEAFIAFLREVTYYPFSVGLTNVCPCCGAKRELLDGSVSCVAHAEDCTYWMSSDLWARY